MHAVDRAVRTLPAGRLLLAVSGGLDSMVLLHAVSHAAAADGRSGDVVVATFDHGTGAAAADAVQHVLATAAALGVAAVAGGGMPLAPTEAAWRDARWAFLRTVAARDDATIATAHTADDQAETVLLRAMRDAGARGLAGLAAAGPVRRPFLALRRAVLVDYADRGSIRWVHDPSNADMRFARNRVRRDILPALERAHPGFADALLDIGAGAAQWRAAMDAVASAACPSTPRPAGGLSVAAARLVGYDPSSLAVLWASIAGRAGIALDQRGTRRLAAFTTGGAPGGLMPLSGGWQVERTRDAFVLAPARPAAPAAAMLDVAGGLSWGRWRFAPGRGGEADGRWTALLPADVPLLVRGWEPADRVATDRGRVRVKRVLTEAGIAAAGRAGWPVVVADDAIVWIPGVCRAIAATARSGRPGVCIRCDPRD